MRHALTLLATVTALNVFFPHPSPAAPIDADIVLVRGSVIDGTGSPAVTANVAIRDGKIIAVGDFEIGDAKQRIDCKDLVISPGFIDLHNHSDYSILSPETRNARCYQTQGCATLVTGNCGGGRDDVGKYYDDMATAGIGINIAQLAPHGSIRDKVMGKVRRAPTEAELEKMKQLTAAAMEQGAWGMSTGLQYVPGSYADVNELAAIAEVVGQHGGIYASHIRDEGDELIESVEEVIEIAKRGHLPCHVSHMKASKKNNWGKVRAAAHLIESSRNEGLTITADQYPYTASSTSIMAMLLPDEEREGGESAAAERLKDPKQAERLRPIVAEALAGRGPILVASYSDNKKWVGKLIDDIAKIEGREPIEIAMDILRNGKAQGVNFGMDEADVRFVMTLPWVATASDGSSKIDDGSSPHPRSFGTFPRKIGRYAIQENVLPLPAAIRSATGLAADIIGFKDRGYIREGQAADIAVFDPKTLTDNATYDKPFEESTGVCWLLVNGKVAIADRKPQDVFAGQPLRHESTKSKPSN